MPHFGQMTKVTNYVMQLLVVFHGGFMWLDKPYFIDLDLILVIIGMPQVGVDQLSLLEKDIDSALIVKVKDKYDLVRVRIWFSVIPQNFLKI